VLRRQLAAQLSFWTSDTERSTQGPVQAWDNAWFNAAWPFWPVKGPAKPLQIKGPGLAAS